MVLRLIGNVYYRLFDDLAARYRDPDLARFNAAIVVGAVNSVYVCCALVGSLIIIGVPPASIKANAEPLVAATFVVGLAFHYFVLATRGRHSSIESGFDRAQLAKKLPTVLVVIWWIGAPSSLILMRALFGRT